MGQLKILGCGSSAGVPAIGNWWGACDPADKRNLRTRPSVTLETDNTMLVIDTGPDFREQMNREKLRCPDAILFTHKHADHVNGIDELRILQRRFKRKFPIYSNRETLDNLLSRYDHMFKTTEDGFYADVCEPNELVMGKELTIGDITFTPFEQDHGTILSVGFRLGPVGYSTDVKRLEQPAYDVLKGVETWIVDGAGYHDAGNPVHATVEEVIAMNQKIGAKRVILTHMPPTMDYKTLIGELPKGYEPAVDGMIIDF